MWYIKISKYTVWNDSKYSKISRSLRKRWRTLYEVNFVMLLNESWLILFFLLVLLISFFFKPWINHFFYVYGRTGLCRLEIEAFLLRKEIFNREEFINFCLNYLGDVIIICIIFMWNIVIIFVKITLRQLCPEAVIRCFLLWVTFRELNTLFILRGLLLSFFFLHYWRKY